MESSLRSKIVSLLANQSKVGDQFADVVAWEGQENIQTSILVAAYDISNNVPVLLHVFPSISADHLRYLPFFVNEFDLLRRLKNKDNIIQLADGFDGLGSIEIVESPVSISLPYYATEKPDSILGNAMYADPRIELILLLDYFGGCCKAIQRLHNMGCAHGDLRPGSFFIIDGTTKLSVFGCHAQTKSTQAFAPKPPRTGWYYVAPELLFNDAPQFDDVRAGDFFSLGAILFEMMSQRILGQDLYDRNLLVQLRSEARVIPLEEMDSWSKSTYPHLASRRSLPPITNIGVPLPSEIASRVSSLYTGLAAPDIKRRTTNFAEVFTTLAVIQMCLAKNTAYKKIPNYRGS